ncbi:MAG TPA: hypothetical protein VHH34_07015 [Pseudonocardiaceae bacterium]|nr:hypothetical protein [Pseudonocardiaceae bacterium]
MYSPMRERRSTIGRLAWWAFWLVVLVYVLHDPREAADTARDVLAWLVGAAEAIITFLQQAAGGAR